MKLAYLSALVLTMSACATTQTGSTAVAQGAVSAEAIRAFEDVCLKTAPSFDGAIKAAGSVGITKLTDAKFMMMGFNKDQSLGFQVKANVECVITTPSQENGTLTTQFLETVRRHATTGTFNRVPTRATVAGQTFAFTHNRGGGEAFVMLKVK